MTAVSFFVPGIAAPQGSKKIVHRRGFPYLVDDNDGAKQAWRDAVVTVAGRYARRSGFDCAVRVDLEFVFPMPKSRRAVVRRTGEAPMAVKPDIDKLARNVLDGLKDAGVVVEDSRVQHLDARKVESSMRAAGVHVRVAPIMERGAA